MAVTKIKRIPFLNVAGFLLYNEISVVLVDTGHAKTTDKLVSSLHQIGKSTKDVQLIVLTHTHFDHAGGAQKIKDLTSAKLAVHKSEAAFLQKGRTPFPKGTRWKGKLMVSVGRVFTHRMANYPPLKADILIDEYLDLKPYGIDGKVLHTPGHTEGSVSVFLENGNAIVGDNVMGISIKEHYPPFANNRKKVIESWERYISEDVKIVHPAHGSSVQIEALVEELQAARKKYSSY